MKYILIFILFILFPICGIQSLEKGEIGSGIFFLFPLFALICGIVFNLCVVEPRKKRQEALYKMYNLPDVVRDEYGHTWDREFQQVISKAIEEATDNEKRADLLQCQKVAKGMIKDSAPHQFDLHIIALIRLSALLVAISQLPTHKAKQLLKSYNHSLNIINYVFFLYSQSGSLFCSLSNGKNVKTSNTNCS